MTFLLGRSRCGTAARSSLFPAFVFPPRQPTHERRRHVENAIVRRVVGYSWTRDYSAYLKPCALKRPSTAALFRASRIRTAYYSRLRPPRARAVILCGKRCDAKVPALAPLSVDFLIFRSSRRLFANFHCKPWELSRTRRDVFRD